MYLVCIKVDLDLSACVYDCVLCVCVTGLQFSKFMGKVAGVYVSKLKAWHLIKAVIV